MPKRVASQIEAAVAGLRALAGLCSARPLMRLAVVAVLACVLIGAGLNQGMASVPASRAGLSEVSHHQHRCPPAGAHEDHGAPCKHNVPACMSNIGCLLVIGIPATLVRISEHLSWAPMSYWLRSETVRGITSEPALGPPIRVA